MVRFFSVRAACFVGLRFCLVLYAFGVWSRNGFLRHGVFFLPFFPPLASAVLSCSCLRVFVLWDLFVAGGTLSGRPRCALSCFLAFVHWVGPCGPLSRRHLFVRMRSACGSSALRFFRFIPTFSWTPWSPSRRRLVTLALLWLFRPLYLARLFSCAASIPSSSWSPVAFVFPFSSLPLLSLFALRLGAALVLQCLYSPYSLKSHGPFGLFLSCLIYLHCAFPFVKLFVWVPFVHPYSSRVGFSLVSFRVFFAIFCFPSFSVSLLFVSRLVSAVSSSLAGLFLLGLLSFHFCFFGFLLCFLVGGVCFFRQLAVDPFLLGFPSTPPHPRVPPPHCCGLILTPFMSRTARVYDVLFVARPYGFSMVLVCKHRLPSALVVLLGLLEFIVLLG